MLGVLKIQRRSDAGSITLWPSASEMFGTLACVTVSRIAIEVGVVVQQITT